MRQGNEHIGGIENGDNSGVRIRHIGKNAGSYLAKGLVLLGQHKARMQLEGLFEMRSRTIEVAKGVFIQAHSILGEDGFPDNDTLIIDTSGGGVFVEERDFHVIIIHNFDGAADDTITAYFYDDPVGTTKPAFLHDTLQFREVTILAPEGAAFNYDAAWYPDDNGGFIQKTLVEADILVNPGSEANLMWTRPPRIHRSGSEALLELKDRVSFYAIEGGDFQDSYFGQYYTDPKIIRFESLDFNAFWSSSYDVFLYRFYAGKLYCIAYGSVEGPIEDYELDRPFAGHLFGMYEYGSPGGLPPEHYPWEKRT